MVPDVKVVTHTVPNTLLYRAVPVTNKVRKELWFHYSPDQRGLLEKC